MEMPQNVNTTVCGWFPSNGQKFPSLPLFQRKTDIGKRDKPDAILVKENKEAKCRPINSVNNKTKHQSNFNHKIHKLLISEKV